MLWICILLNEILKNYDTMKLRLEQNALRNYIKNCIWNRHFFTRTHPLPTIISWEIFRNNANTIVRINGPV